MITIVEENAKLLVSRFAIDFESALGKILSSQQKAFVLLTGGTLGIEILGKFSELDIDFRRVEFCFSDERFVSADSPDRNEHQAEEIWPGIKQVNLWRYPEPKQDLTVSASQFSERFSRTFGPVSNKEAVFDLAIIGVGPDGHIASLFPNHNYSEDWVVAESNSPKPPKERLSLSYKALSRIKRVWVLAAGASKANAISSGMNPLGDLPISKLRGQEETRWYLDQELSDEL